MYNGREYQGRALARGDRALWLVVGLWAGALLALALVLPYGGGR